MQRSFDFDIACIVINESTMNVSTMQRPLWNTASQIKVFAIDPHSVYTMVGNQLKYYSINGHTSKVSGLLVNKPDLVNWPSYYL